MKNTLKIALLVFLMPLVTNSQFIHSYGLKLGPTLTGQYSHHENSNDETGTMNLFSYDFGAFIEIMNLKRLSISNEVHYSVKGISEENAVTISPAIPGQYYYKPLSNRFEYLSFEPLAKYKFFVSKSHEFFLMAGPRWDFRIGNYRYDSQSEDFIHIKNFRFEFGMSIGTGVEFSEGLLLELRFEPNFTGTYKYTNDYTSYSTRHSTIMLLGGFAINKYFKGGS